MDGDSAAGRVRLAAATRTGLVAAARRLTRKIGQPRRRARHARRRPIDPGAHTGRPPQATPGGSRSPSSRRTDRPGPHSRWNASAISRDEKKIKVITTEPNSSSTACGTVASQRASSHRCPRQKPRAHCAIGAASVKLASTSARSGQSVRSPAGGSSDRVRDRVVEGHDLAQHRVVEGRLPDPPPRRRSAAATRSAESPPERWPPRRESPAVREYRSVFAGLPCADRALRSARTEGLGDRCTVQPCTPTATGGSSCNDARRRPRRQAPRNGASILDSARELGIRDAQGSPCRSCSS